MGQQTQLVVLGPANAADAVVSRASDAQLGLNPGPLHALCRWAVSDFGYVFWVCDRELKRQMVLQCIASSA